MKKVMLTMRIGGQNGGPYVSHSRIMSSRLKEKYLFEPLYIPRSRILMTPWGMKKMVKRIQESNPDIVQVSGLQLEGYLTMIACKLAGVRTVLAIHGSSLEAESLGYFYKVIIEYIEKWTIKSADIVYGVSDYVCNWEVCKKAKCLFGTIYNIPLTPKTELARSTARTKMGIQNSDIVIASSGRVVREKGYDILWEAIQLLGKRPDVNFYIAGDGAFRAEWQQDILEKGFEEQVHLLGYQKEVDELLAASDIFIMCTHHETLCISLLEAAMYELPLIATDVGGIPEIIEHQKNGYLVKNLDVMGFADALNVLIENRTERERLGKNAKIIVEQKFDEADICEKLDRMYAEVLSLCLEK